MDPNRWIAKRRENWQQLEELLMQIEEKGVRSLNAAQAQMFGRLYRRTAADLAVVQAQIASYELESYLNTLMARSFPVMYRQQKRTWRRTLSVLWEAVPSLLRRTATVHLLAMSIFMGSGLFGFLAYSMDSQAAFFFRPGGVEKLERSLQRSEKMGAVISSSVAPVFATKIMTNNIQVCFLAFALGLTFGIGTFLLLWMNGLLLGTYAAVAHKYGVGTLFWSYILPHGIIELTAIFMAGGAGFLLAKALWFPGEKRRRDALREQGRAAIQVVLAIIPMLIVAGLIEGFVTPAGGLGAAAKLLFALATVPPLLIFLGFRPWLSKTTQNTPTQTRLETA